MRVLHICTQKTWRGGENQVRLFIEGSFRYGVVNFVAVPQGGRSHHRFIELVETLGLPGSGSLNPLSIYRLVQFCQRNQIDIIDGQGSGGLALALWVKKVLPQIQVVTHRRVEMSPEQGAFAKKRYFSPAVRRFVAISNQVKESMISAGVKESKVVVVPSGIESDLYKRLDRTWLKQKLGAENQISSDDIFIGSANSLTEEKGIRYLIEAFEMIHQTRKDVRLFLAGEGNDQAALEKMVKSKGLSEHVRFLGHLTNLPEFLAGVDILAMPTLSEGLGTVLLDSISAGTPVVATRVGGIPEVVRDGETGFLVEPKNADELKTSILKLIDNPKLRDQFVAKGRDYISAQFSLEKMIAANIQIYRDTQK